MPAQCPKTPGSTALAGELNSTPLKPSWCHGLCMSTNLPGVATVFRKIWKVRTCV